MPNLKLTNLVSYRQYFADIAANHLEIDGFKWGDKQVIQNDSRSDLPARFLWAQPYESGKYGDSYSDNILKTKTAKVAYFITPDSALFADEDAAYDTAEAVIEQIMSKILIDKRGGLSAGEWSMIVSNINTWTISPVEYVLGSTRWIGCELSIDFGDNTNLEYDASKWR